MWWRKPSLIERRKQIDAINKTNKLQEYQSKKDKYIGNESNKCISLDKSRASKGTETEDTVKTISKSRYIPSAILSDKSTNTEEPK